MLVMFMIQLFLIARRISQIFILVRGSFWIVIMMGALITARAELCKGCVAIGEAGI
jgi:hypothetical protein